MTASPRLPRGAIGGRRWDPFPPRPGAARLVLVVLLLVTATIVVPATRPAEAATTFRGWVFTPEVSAIRSDGLALNDVSFNGVRLFERISFPAMSVYYDQNVCGPYLDRIGGSVYVTEPSREFTWDGVRWLSLGITDYIGNYVITQMFYLSEDGRLDAHVFSKGLQCNIRHEHVPFWRLDLDLGGPGTDQVRRSTPGGVVVEDREFSLPATAASGHGWEVRDAVTGDRLTIAFDDGSFGLGADPVQPESNYEHNMVHGRNYRPAEEVWQGGPSRGLFGNDGETMNDLVLWYSGFMPHTPEEGPSLWHSTGIRMRVNPDAPAGIEGAVRGASGSLLDDVKVDLFTAGRSQFLQTARTVAGRFGFSVEPGCYVLTFIAPAGTSLEGGGAFLNRSVCVGAGQTSSGNDATVLVAGAGASVGDRVTWADGTGAGGVTVDLFTTGRAMFLGTTTTDSQGRYRFDLVGAQCGVVTFIAPQDAVFGATGTRYQNSPFCVADSQNLSTVDAVLVGGASLAGLGGRVTAVSGSGVADVRVVLFEANPDGSRRLWLRSAVTDATGRYQFTVAAGCYVLDFVAPGGRTWTATGGTYQRQASCVDPGQENLSLSAVLN